MHRMTFIGGGNMARSLVGGLIGTGADPASIAIAEPRAEAARALWNANSACAPSPTAARPWTAPTSWYWRSSRRC